MSASQAGIAGAPAARRSSSASAFEVTVGGGSRPAGTEESVARGAGLAVAPPPPPSPATQSSLGSMRTGSPGVGMMGTPGGVGVRQTPTNTSLGGVQANMARRFSTSNSPPLSAASSAPLAGSSRWAVSVAGEDVGTGASTSPARRGAHVTSELGRSGGGGSGSARTPPPHVPPISGLSSSQPVNTAAAAGAGAHRLGALASADGGSAYTTSPASARAASSSFSFTHTAATNAPTDTTSYTLGSSLAGTIPGGVTSPGAAYHRLVAASVTGASPTSGAERAPLPLPLSASPSVTGLLPSPPTSPLPMTNVNASLSSPIAAVERLARENSMLRSDVTRLTTQLTVAASDTAALRERLVEAEASSRSAWRKVAALEAEDEALRTELMSKHEALLSLSQGGGRGGHGGSDNLLSVVAQLENVRREVDDLRQQLADAVAAREAAAIRAAEAEEGRAMALRSAEDASHRAIVAQEARNRAETAAAEARAAASAASDLAAAETARITAAAAEARAVLEARTTTEVQRTLDDAASQNRLLEAAMEALRLRLLSTENALDESRREEARLRGVERELRNALTGAGAEAAAERQLRLASEDRAAQEREDANSTTRALAERLAAAVEEARTLASAHESLAGEYTRTLSEGREAAASASRYAEEVSSLRTRFATQASATANTLHEREVELAEAQTRAVRADARMAELEAMVSALSTELTALQPSVPRLAAAEQEVSALRTRLRDAEAMLAAAGSQQEALSAALRVANLEMEGLRSEAASAQASVLELRTAVRDAEVRVSEAEASMPPAAVAALNAANSRCRRLEGMLLQLQRSNEELGAAAESWEQRALDASAAAAAMTRARGQDNAAAAAAAGRSVSPTLVRRLRESLSSKDATIASLREELDTQRDEVAALMGELAVYRKVDVYSLTLHRQVRAAQAGRKSGGSVSSSTASAAVE